MNSYAQKKIIFDTDFGGDADDLGALAMLHTYIDANEIDLLAVMCWSTEQYAVSGIDAVNTFYGRPDIPIGIRDAGVFHEPWNHSKPIVENHDYDVTPENAENATFLYRKLLSEAEDQSITIITVGPLTNLLYLLESGSDDISELTGKELVHQKVKEFVIMGGQFPSGESEWNFNGNMPGVTRKVLSEIEVPLTFLGYEVGLIIKTGLVFNNIDKNHPLYLGYYHFSKNAPWIKEHYAGAILDNASYDQTAVLYAVENGVGSLWNRVEIGICVPDDHGGNTWQEVEESNHNYLRLIADPEEVAQLIESRMLGRIEE
jgi:inosine-uridine nucleoside N-ribohydrolase